MFCNKKSKQKICYKINFETKKNGFTLYVNAFVFTQCK